MIIQLVNQHVNNLIDQILDLNLVYHMLYQQQIVLCNIFFDMRKENEQKINNIKTYRNQMTTKKTKEKKKMNE